MKHLIFIFLSSYFMINKSISMDISVIKMFFATILFHVAVLSYFP